MNRQSTLRRTVLSVTTNRDIRFYRCIGDITLFNGIDVAQYLGYADPMSAINKICRNCRKIKDDSEKQEILVIGISDIIRLVLPFPNSDSADIEKWLIDTVLTSMVMTGDYIMEPV